MSRRLFAAVVLAVTLGFTAQPAQAALIGANVFGEIYFGGGGINYYDPANGFVPAGFLNTAGPNVVIAEPAIEFGFADGANTDTTNFTNTQLIFRDVSAGGGTNILLRFTSAAFAGLSLIELSDNFLNGGVTATLVGNVITLTVPAFAQGGTFQAVYEVTSVPEPATLLLVGTGVAAAVRARRRTRR